jgi:TetR/AcrR family transcriptional repressor of lmrAB and yxaGH operons
MRCIIYRLVYFEQPMTTPKGAASRERMIDAAIALMRGSGLSGAGINEVVKASGAPKGSVYHFFPEGKQQLACEALEVYALRVQAFIEAAMAGATRPDTRVRALFAAFAQRLEQAQCRASCAAGAVCLDLDADLERVRDSAAGAFELWAATIADRLGLPDARRARSFAGLVLTAVEGAYVRGRAQGSGEPFREAGRWLAELAALGAAR